jgi:deoxyribose-phosphate aldolase
MPATESEIAALIDHTLLRADATDAEVRLLCEEAIEFHFASVCVNPWYVPLAAELLHGHRPRICTVIGFPLGASLSRVKAFEAQSAIDAGAQEIDMVINIGALKSGNYDAVETDIRGVADTAHRANAICKAIIETALLSHDEKIRASLIAKHAGADFVKTSTGFSTAGATEGDVRLMRDAGRHNRREGFRRDSDAPRFAHDVRRRGHADRLQFRRKNHSGISQLGLRRAPLQRSFNGRLLAGQDIRMPRSSPTRANSSKRPRRTCYNVRIRTRVRRNCFFLNVL